MPARIVLSWDAHAWLGAVMLLVAGGCAHVPLAARIDEALDRGVVSRFESPLLDPIRASLSAEQWRRNYRWNITQAYETRRGSIVEPAHLRWQFGKSRPVEESGGKRVAVSEGDSASVEWDGLWPLTPADLIHRDSASSAPADASRTEALACLRHLAEGDDLPAWNAAILCAQHDPSAAVSLAGRLERIIANPPSYQPVEKPTVSDQKQPSSDPPPSRPPKTTLSLPTRCAAAEIWCAVLACAADDPIDGLAPAGLLLERSDLPVEVRGEIFRGVARWITPADIPRLENAFRQDDQKQRPPVEIRKAAIDACAIHACWNQPESAGGQRIAAEAWPATIAECRIDPDREVRRRWVEWLGVAQPPDALATLRTQLGSTDLEIRTAAIKSLGRIHTKEALGELRDQATRSRDVLRAATVHELAAWGHAEIDGFARDASHLVRQAVARELGHTPTVQSAVLLAELAVDSHVDVQRTAVEAVRNWPDDMAYPLLLAAMRDSSPKARQRAAQDVARRQGGSATTAYQFDGPPEQRLAAVQSIAASTGASTNYLDKVLLRGPRERQQIDAIRAAEISSHLRQFVESPPGTGEANAASAWLNHLSAGDVPAIEQFLQQPSKVPVDAIYSDVLPKLSPAYQALIDLEKPEVDRRRVAMRTLAESAGAKTLNACILRRLRELLTHETDELVWRSAMTAIGGDASDDCAELALLALHHRSPEIRQLGCEYFQKHGQQPHARVLLELLADSNRNVKLAAIRALGRCGNRVAIRGVAESEGKASTAGLLNLLTSADATVQFEAAKSLCRLGSPEGMQELTRLTCHHNATVREQSVAEMGRSGQSRFVPTLIALAWTEKQESVRRAILVSLDQLVPVENRPAGIEQTPSIDAKIRQWAQWSQSRRGGSVSPLGAPLVAEPADAA